MRREGWVWTFVAATIVGLLLRQPSLIVMAILLSAAGGLAVYWGKYSLARVTYQRRLSAHKAFQGDVITLDITLTNRKFLPLPYIQIDDLVPEFFESATLKLAPAGVERMKKLKLTTSLGWYEKIDWSFPIECTRRGSYRLGGHTLRSADPFGFFPSQLNMPADTRLLVYPELRTMADLGLEETMPFGGDSGGDPLFTDPLRIKGTRDYAPGDPIYLVDWKATAKVQRLQTRLVEPVAVPQVLVFLDVDTFELSWEGTDPEALEDAVSVAASIAYASAEKRFAVGLYSNGTLADYDAAVRLRPSRHPEHVTEMLELLAKVTPISSGSITALISEEVREIAARTFVFVVTAVPRKGLTDAGRQLRSQGVPASLVYVGREALAQETVEAGWHDVISLRESAEKAESA